MLALCPLSFTNPLSRPSQIPNWCDRPSWSQNGNAHPDPHMMNYQALPAAERMDAHRWCSWASNSCESICRPCPHNCCAQNVPLPADTNRAVYLCVSVWRKRLEVALATEIVCHVCYAPLFFARQSKSGARHERYWPASGAKFQVGFAVKPYVLTRRKKQIHCTITVAHQVLLMALRLAILNHINVAQQWLEVAAIAFVLQADWIVEMKNLSLKYFQFQVTFEWEYWKLIFKCLYISSRNNRLKLKGNNTKN